MRVHCTYRRRKLLEAVGWASLTVREEELFSALSGSIIRRRLAVAILTAAFDASLFLRRRSWASLLNAHFPEVVALAKTPPSAKALQTRRDN